METKMALSFIGKVKQIQPIQSGSKQKMGLPPSKCGYTTHL